MCDGYPELGLAKIFSTSFATFSKLDWKQILSVLYQVCIRANPLIKVATIASDWLIHFELLLCNHCTGFEEA